VGSDLVLAVVAAVSASPVALTAAFSSSLHAASNEPRLTAPKPASACRLFIRWLMATKVATCV